MTDVSGIVLSRRASAAAVLVRMHHKGARTYTPEQVNYDERILFIDRSAGSGADIIAKGWKENHWARPTIKDSYFPSEETELILDLLKEGGQNGGQTSGQSTTETTTEKVLDLLKSNPYLINREMADMLTLSEDGVFYQIKKLKAKGIIVRIGGDKGGQALQSGNEQSGASCLLAGAVQPVRQTRQQESLSCQCAVLRHRPEHHTSVQTEVLFHPPRLHHCPTDEANFLKDFGASLRDFFGGRTDSYEKAKLEGRETAQKEMRERAEKLGANAIVGVSFGYETMGQANSMIMISISGTAVVID